MAQANSFLLDRLKSPNLEIPLVWIFKKNIHVCLLILFIHMPFCRRLDILNDFRLKIFTSKSASVVAKPTADKETVTILLTYF